MQNAATFKRLTAGFGSKGQLDITIEVDGEIDLACLAMNVRLDVFQRQSAFLWTTTKRTKQIPLKVEQTGSRRTQTNFQHQASRFLPVVGKLVRSNAGDREVVAMFEKVSQTFGDRESLSGESVVSRSAISFCLSAVSLADQTRTVKCLAQRLREQHPERPSRRTSE